MDKVLILERLDGMCYRGIIDNQDIQVQIIPKSHIFAGKQYQNIRRWIEIQYHINHIHIQRLHFYTHDDTNLYILTEYMPHGSLKNRIKYTDITENTLKTIYVQLLSVFDYLQKRHLFINLTVDNIYFDSKDNVKVSNLKEILHKSNKSMNYQSIGQILYACLYKRYCKIILTIENDEVVYQPQLIFWKHTPISDELKDLITQLIGQQIESMDQLLTHKWIT